MSRSFKLTILLKPIRNWAKVANTVSKSRAVLACSTSNCSPSLRAATCRFVAMISLMTPAAGVNEQCNSTCCGHQFMQQLHPFWPYLCGQRSYTRQVPARPGETCDISGRDWVVAGAEDDRNGCGRSLCCQHRRRAVRGNHGHLAPDQIGYQRRELIVLAVGPAIF